MPTFVAETVRVEVPEPTTLEGETEDVTSTGAEIVKETVPANPFSPVTVTVEVPEEPAMTVSVEGLAPMVKSTTFTVTTAEWERDL